MAWFFGLHNYSKPGRGVRKDEPPKTGMALYFDILLRRFWNIITLNLIYLIFSIPAIIISFFLSTYMISWMASVAQIDLNGEMGQTFSLIGLFGAVLLLHICGSGGASAGMTYVLRKYVNDTHTWVWSDFIESIKSNFKQSMAIYVINIFAMVFFVVGYTFYTHIMTGVAAFVLKGLITAMALIFILMQMYIYQLMVGFELSVKKIYEYAAILAIVKLPWNILSAAVSMVLMYIVYELFMLYPVIVFILILTLFFTIISYTQIFMTNNVIKKYILEPALKKTKIQENTENDFEDDLK